MKMRVVGATCSCEHKFTYDEACSRFAQFCEGA